MEQTTKRCSKCLVDLPLTEFAKANNHKSGLQRYCITCKAQVFKQYRSTERGKQVVRHSNLWKKFGISHQEYERMHREQDGKCAICRNPETCQHRNGKVSLLAVDHDHDSGRVRGLLCNACNTAIGLLRDDPKILRRAIKYLAE